MDYIKLSRDMKIDAEDSDGIHVKLCWWIAVFLQHLLDTSHATVELVDYELTIPDEKEWQEKNRDLLGLLLR